MGLYRSNRHFKIAPRFDGAHPFQAIGLVVVSVNSRYGLINVNGQFVVTLKYSLINEFSEGRAVVQTNEQSNSFKLIDELGVEVTSKSYDYIWSLQDDRACFYMDNITDLLIVTAAMKLFLQFIRAGKVLLMARQL